MRRQPSLACWRLPNAPICTSLPLAPDETRDGQSFSWSRLAGGWTAGAGAGFTAAVSAGSAFGADSPSCSATVFDRSLPFISIGLSVRWRRVERSARGSGTATSGTGAGRTSGVSGNLNSIGSDTLNNLMTLWAEGFRAIYPNVNIQIEGKGSSTAPPALIEGTAQLGPMSRPMKDSEKQAFEQKYGYKPVEIPVAIDALAVFVHKDNPIKSLDIAQVDHIGRTKNGCGEGGCG